MAILGNNVKGTDDCGANAGRMYAGKFTLAAASTLTELHGFLWASGPIRIIMYADSGGVPGTRVAYTALFTGGDTEYSAAGFSVALPAGDYWLGVAFTSAVGLVWCDSSGGTVRYRDGAPDPPPDPFGTSAPRSSQNLSVWAVVTLGGGAPAFVPQVVIT